MPTSFVNPTNVSTAIHELQQNMAPIAPRFVSLHQISVTKLRRLHNYANRPSTSAKMFDFIVCAIISMHEHIATHHHARAKT